MDPLSLQSEKYSPTGNVASEGVLNQLGRPRMDPLTVLIREAIQNSWDARIPGGGVVTFGLSLRTLTQEQMAVFKQVVFFQVPGRLGLREKLNSDEPIRVLEVYDRGTSGLGGPTRADMPDTSSEPRDFVDFMRNVGQPPDKKLGAGTFGYGKAALYVASRLHTICVHTRANYKRNLVSRFMAAGLGGRYSITNPGPDQGIYTGRHWWGYYDGEIVEPLTGASAEDLARMLGFPGYADSEIRGTSIVILEPFIGERTSQQAINAMKLAILWYFWPKMLGTDNTPPAMSFDIYHEGVPVEVPRPENFPPINGFVRAMENLRKNGQDEDGNPLSTVTKIRVLRPKKNLGKLSLIKLTAEPRQELDVGEVDGLLPFSGPAHHSALMRQAELIVKYVAGPPLPSDAIEYAGVFLTDEDVDGVFAGAEPPTHDDWIHEFLEKRFDKTCIRVAYRRIHEEMEAFVAPPDVDDGDGSGVPLGAFAGTLGTLLMGQEGPGAGVRISRSSIADGDGSGVVSDPGVSKGEAGTRKDAIRKPVSRARIRLLDNGKLRMLRGHAVLTTSFSVTHATESKGTLVKVLAGVVLDGNQMEAEPPAGVKQPSVLGWRDPDGKGHKVKNEPEILIPSTSDGVWMVVVTIPDNTMVGIDFRISEVR